MTTETRFETPWEWRKASGGWWHRDDRDQVYFHAYDVNDNSACEPHLGLAASAAPPNEGSALCRECIKVMKGMPAGRARR